MGFSTWGPISPVWAPGNHVCLGKPDHVPSVSQWPIQRKMKEGVTLCATSGARRGIIQIIYIFLTQPRMATWTVAHLLKGNSYIFIQEMHFKMSSGKWRPFCLGLIVMMCLLLTNRPRHPLAGTRWHNHWDVLTSQWKPARDASRPTGTEIDNTRTSR